MAQCTARSKRTGQRCGVHAMRGSHVCYHHGGRSRKGIAHPGLTQGGKYSKLLPLKLATAYAEARADPDLHALIDEIALTEARVRELLGRLDSSDLGHAWTQLDAAWQAFARCRSAGDVPGMQAALADLEPVIARGAQDYLLWGEISNAVKLLADLRLKEHRRLVDLQTMISAERANVVFGLLLRSVHSAVITHAAPDVASTILVTIQDAIRGLDLHAVAGPALRGARAVGGNAAPEAL